MSGDLTGLCLYILLTVLKFDALDNQLNLCWGKGRSYNELNKCINVFELKVSPSTLKKCINVNQELLVKFWCEISQYGNQLEIKW